MAAAAAEGLVPVRRALISVFDKTGIEALALGLAKHGVTVLSTGGTAKKLREAPGGLNVIDVADVTKFKEMLGGRVKTLHPAIHGGLLANRNEPQHMQELKDNDIEPIDLVVSNLYPFTKTVASGKPFEDCIEMIDIGGPTMVRAAAKNCDSVAVITSPAQYAKILQELDNFGGKLSKATRRELACEAFSATAQYDSAVAAYFSKETKAAVSVPRLYTPTGALRYGVNPHQKPANYSETNGCGSPFVVKNGSPGYTNLMDALNAWQLVSEVQQSLGIVAAASFKHVSPAGVGLGLPLTEAMVKAYGVEGKDLTPTALAYIRARNADPMSSFGDFIAVSGVVDECTALLIKREVSDGIIAAGFEDKALEILISKKGGKYLVLEAVPGYAAPADEYKEVYGVAVSQTRNTTLITSEHMTKDVKTEAQMAESAVRDLVLATIAVKYTQSNSVCFAVDGQVVGVGAGQQSRVDCVKLAGRKVRTWHMRMHPKVLALPFKDEVKRVDRTNGRVAYIMDDMTDKERIGWLNLFTKEPEPLTEAERTEWCAKLSNVCLSSDAFFPFRDNIDQCSKFGVKYIAQTGGSNNDADVTLACNEYGISMAFTGVRLFHH